MDEIYLDKIKTLNDMSAAYKRCLQKYNMNGYISIEEEFGEWDKEEKFIPVNVHAEDYLTLIPDD